VDGPFSFERKSEMTTFTASRAGSTFPVFKPIGAGLLCAAYGTIEIAANPADGDIYEMCKIPAGAVVVGGMIYADDLDTGTEALDMDIGWAANGAEVADPDGFGNLGVWTGDATTDVKPVAGIMYPLQGKLLTDGPQAFTRETTIQIEANAAANAGGTGTLSVVVHYVVP
jgi:hypothetical protein